MVRLLPYILTGAFCLGQAGIAAAAPDGKSGLWAEVCGSSQNKWISLGPENETPQPPVHTKACHAVCCTREICIQDEPRTKTKT